MIARKQFIQLLSVTCKYRNRHAQITLHMHILQYTCTYSNTHAHCFKYIKTKRDLTSMAGYLMAGIFKTGHGSPVFIWFRTSVAVSHHHCEKLIRIPVLHIWPETPQFWNSALVAKSSLKICATDHPRVSSPLRLKDLNLRTWRTLNPSTPQSVWWYSQHP